MRTRIRTARIRTRTVSAVLAAGLLAAGSVALAAPASAAGTTGPVVTQEGADARGDLLRQRLAVACARVPAAVRRTDTLQERLAGDEGTRGSLVWLRTRAERAEDRGRTDLAEALQARLEVRTELAELLPLRREALVAAQEHCDEAGL